MSRAPGSAAQITRGSQSNLALAFVALPREQREDMAVFYAFCRLVDDLADEPGETADKAKGLDTWRRALAEPLPDEPDLAPAVRALIAKHHLSLAHFQEIIDGCAMDLEPVRYRTWEDLRVYCHRVASVVGLVSVGIFGARDPLCREYAEQLGLALQLTNILRDVGADLANGGRVYLPEEDLARFGVTAEDLEAQRHDAKFRALMEFEADRAAGFYEAARRCLPPAERRTMVAAEIMAAIYGRLLTMMRRDGFRVFGRRYSVPKWRKAAIILQTMLAARWG